MAQPSQFWKMKVADFRGAEFARENVAAELWVTTGPRNGAHINHAFDAMRP